MKEYREEEYYINAKNGRIYGKLYIPEEVKKAPIMIISHGFNGSYIGNEDYAKHFVQLGFLVYIYDFNGGATNSKSEGKMTEMSVMTEVQDLEEVIANIKQLPTVDPEKIVLIGKSQGGFVSAVVAARHPNEITRLVLIYPAFVIHDDARKNLKDYTKETLPEKYVVFDGVNLGKIYAEDVWDYDVFQEIRNYKDPVLIIHGSNDQLVPFSYSERAHDVYENSELYILDGAEHGFSEEYTKIAWELIDNFVEPVLK